MTTTTTMTTTPAVVLQSPGFDHLVRSIIDYLDWRDILHLSQVNYISSLLTHQVCTNLNDIVTTSTAAQIKLRGGLIGRDTSLLPATRASLSRLVDIEQRWAALTPAAHHSFRYHPDVYECWLATSEGVAVTPSAEPWGWTVWDLRNLRDFPDEPIPSRTYASDLRFFSGENVVVSSRHNLMAVLQPHPDVVSDSGQVGSIRVKLHLFQLFSDTGDAEYHDDDDYYTAQYYTPIPHPEAADPVLEIANYAIPGDDLCTRSFRYLDCLAQHDDCNQFELDPGNESTLFVRCCLRPSQTYQPHDFPIGLWDWRTGKQAMDLRFDKYRPTPEDYRFWRKPYNQPDEYFHLPDGNVLAFGLARLDGPGLIQGKLVPDPTSTKGFNLEQLYPSDLIKPAYVFTLLSNNPNSNSHPKPIQSPLCTLGYVTDFQTTTDPNRHLYLISISPEKATKGTIILPAGKLRSFLAANNTITDLNDLLESTEADVVFNWVPHLCVGGMRAISISQSNSDWILHVANYATRAMEGTPISSRYRTQASKPQPQRRTDVLSAIREWAVNETPNPNPNPKSTNAKICAHFHPCPVTEVESIHAGAEHLITSIITTDRELEVHILSF